MSRLCVIAVALVGFALWTASPMATGGVAAFGHSAERAFSPETVAPGGKVTVTIIVQDYGSFGQVVESIPEGFQFLEASLSDAAVEAIGNTIKFTLLGEEQFSYTLVAPDSEGEYILSGVLLDSFRDEREIGSATVLRIGGTVHSHIRAHGNYAAHPNGRCHTGANCHAHTSASTCGNVDPSARAHGDGCPRTYSVIRAHAHW